MPTLSVRRARSETDVAPGEVGPSVCVALDRPLPSVRSLHPVPLPRHRLRLFPGVGGPRSIVYGTDVPSTRVPTEPPSVSPPFLGPPVSVAFGKRGRCVLGGSGVPDLRVSN